MISNQDQNSANLKEELATLSNDQLLAIYSNYAQRFNHTIDIQWKISSIFIPLSLSGIVAGVKTTEVTIFIGLFSILLIWLWYLLAYRNGRELRMYYIVVATIESLFTKQVFDEIGKGLSIPIPHIAKRWTYTKIFQLICFSITFAWIGVIIYSIITGLNK